MQNTTNKIRDFLLAGRKPAAVKKLLTDKFSHHDAVRFLEGHVYLHEWESVCRSLNLEARDAVKIATGSCSPLDDILAKIDECDIPAFLAWGKCLIETNQEPQLVNNVIPLTGRVS